MRSPSLTAGAAFSALADPTRRAVLEMLRQGSRPAGEISRAFPLSRPAISRHLRLLRRAHLVREQRRGRQRVYHLRPQPLREVDRWLQPYRVFWQGKLAALKAFVEHSENQVAPAGATRTSGKSIRERRRRG